MLHHGVPQGNVLNPLLFNVTFAELPKFLPRNFSYADHCHQASKTCVSKIKDSSQLGLDVIIAFLLQLCWNAHFPTKRAGVKCFHPNIVEPQMFLMSLRKSQSIFRSLKFLGVIFDRQLTWQKHSAMLEEIVNLIVMYCE